MSARDTFEWYVSTQLASKSPAVETFIRHQREYLFTLRSEDETQRFVEWAIAEVAHMVKVEPRPRHQRQPTNPVGK